MTGRTFGILYTVKRRQAIHHRSEKGLAGSEHERDVRPSGNDEARSVQDYRLCLSYSR